MAATFIMRHAIKAKPRGWLLLSYTASLSGGFRLPAMALLGHSALALSGEAAGTGSVQCTRLCTIQRIRPEGGDTTKQQDASRRRRIALAQSKGENR